MNAVLASVDTSEFDTYIASAQQALQNQPAAMAQVAQRLEQNIKSTFTKEADPWGVPWPDWKNPAAILKDRQRRGSLSVAKLYDTGAMFNTIENASDADSAMVSAGDGIDYAAVHQFGIDTIPARPFFPLTSPDVADLPADWIDFVFEPIHTAIEDIFK